MRDNILFMKHIVNALRWLWLAFFVYLGVSFLEYTPKQIKKDRDFIEFQMKPHVNFVKDFQKQHGRLPSEWEFYNKAFDSSGNKTPESYMCSGVYIRSNISGITAEKAEFKNANWDKDYAIRIWRGEWNEYYYSWTDAYDCNNYSWKDGYFALTIMWLIGIVPMLFGLIAVRKGRFSPR
jgi:hypothetical protein